MYPMKPYDFRRKYESVQTLGKGTYGKVELAKQKNNQEKFALKTVRKDKVKNESEMKHIQREIKIMSCLQHPNIIKIHEVFEDEDTIAIIMEYAPNGELYDYLAEKKTVDEDEAREIFKQIVSAVSYCHKHGIVHRDLKLENILLGKNNEIKLADFGLANVFRKDRLLQTFCGSPLYASPEIVNGIKYYGPEVDSWSLGVLLYALVYGMMPFDGSDYKTLTWQITHGEYSKQSGHPDAADLISRMLTVDPIARASIDQIATHWWLSQDSLLPCRACLHADVSTQHKDVHGDFDGLNRHDETCAVHLSADLQLRNSGAVYGHQSALNGTNIQDTKLQKEFVDHTAHSKPCVQNSTPSKSILKHLDLPLSSCEQRAENIVISQKSTSILEGTLEKAIQKTSIAKDQGCGLKTKDSLKLKAKPLGASGKRRSLRSRSNRESGYYSSPEHTLAEIPRSVQSTTSTVAEHSIIKPQFTTALSSITANKTGVSNHQKQKTDTYSGQLPVRCSHLADSVSTQSVSPDTHTPSCSLTNAMNSTANTTCSQHLQLGEETSSCLVDSPTVPLLPLETKLDSTSGQASKSTENLCTGHEEPAKLIVGDQLDEMMQQLNLDLEKARKKAANMRSSFTLTEA